MGLQCGCRKVDSEATWYKQAVAIMKHMGRSMRRDVASLPETCVLFLLEFLGSRMPMQDPGSWLPMQDPGSLLLMQDPGSRLPMQDPGSLMPMQDPGSCLCRNEGSWMTMQDPGSRMLMQALGPWDPFGWAG